MPFSSNPSHLQVESNEVVAWDIELRVFTADGNNVTPHDYDRGDRRQELNGTKFFHESSTWDSEAMSSDTYLWRASTSPSLDTLEASMAKGKNEERALLTACLRHLVWSLLIGCVPKE